MANKRRFTLEQANAVVQAIRPLIAEILDIRQQIIARQEEIWPILARSAGNGGSKIATQVSREFQRLDGLVREIQATGAELKDINTGLVDFLYWREDREVYLCWRFGEDQIGFWHDLEAGVAGRQPL